MQLLSAERAPRSSGARQLRPTDVSAGSELSVASLELPRLREMLPCFCRVATASPGALTF